MSEVLLSLKGVSVRRGSSTVLKNLDLDLEGGQFVLLNGKNGAGKSTIIEAAAGILHLKQAISSIMVKRLLMLKDDQNVRSQPSA